MSPQDFRNLLRELIEENPLAIRAVLKVLAIEFTATVPTLAVTCEARPRLLVNLGFVSEHCHTEAQVKAVICHEFLHILLRHTERFTRLTAADHLALDAVINAIIHRSLGPEYSALMSHYYARETGVARLLRPPGDAEETQIQGRFVLAAHGKISAAERDLLGAWAGLYQGQLVADDIRDLARDHLQQDEPGGLVLLGDHEGLDGNAGLEELPPVLADALGQTLKAMNGSGIFRSPKDRGLGAEAYRAVVPAADTAVDRWRRETYAVLRRHLLPDARSPAREPATATYTLPVLSPGDGRAALRALWSPFLPDAVWRTEVPARAGSAHVYLDVSGSMDAEMPLIVALLGRLTGYIRRPFWAFSNVVAPARIEHGRLVADTTGGTSLGCVLEHLARTRPRAAVVVTDGYIETVDRALLAAASATRLHALVTRDGSAALLQRAGIPYTQLGRLPT
jgi:nitrogen fixation protein FixH